MPIKPMPSGFISVSSRAARGFLEYLDHFDKDLLTGISAFFANLLSKSVQLQGIKNNWPCGLKSFMFDNMEYLFHLVSRKHG
ncbi:hypothetical protein CUJ84_Chr001232 [Rhizobium leguminosarum]|uniref:Uncharacterized protein n=1 Tax=Rhizobium leguminosarum TaxID=384 RepID=A0A2K9Z0A0_RHILE|nr:hypothetical protein CUJ84_Chr001232 [Rhizobium leguminosarum]